jgi:glucose/arabinose dehydrogenase
MIQCVAVTLLLAYATSLTAATGRGYDMDYGPFLSYTVQSTNLTVTKAVTVRLTAGTNSGTIVFDTETLSYAAGWTGGWLDLSKTHLSTYKGELAPRISGRLQFTNDPGPGWARGGSFADPRTNGIGVLPSAWARYRGLYRHGSNVVFRYAVGTAEVLDMPGMMVANGRTFFTRTLHVSGAERPLLMRLGSGRETCAVSNGVSTWVIGDAPANAQPTDPRAFCNGGAAQWPGSLNTVGRRGADSGPFAVDTITVPETNPWRSWMRLTAFDFFSDGRAAVSTWNGDVWIVSGIDDSLRNVRWKRFAAGLFDPLGLKILRDQVYVLERHQITRLDDLNGDGEADYYENINNEPGVSPSYHAFAMDLQADSAGNFYYTRAGQRVDPAYPLNGGMVRVRDGRAEWIAHGLRAANGMGIGPNDEIVCSDNQGNWIPASRLNWIRPGRFYGYVPHAHTSASPTNQEPPLCWIPVSVDNSGGGQAWVTSERWPEALQGHLLHTSYGMASLFVVLHEMVEGVAQGGVVKLPLKFDSGIQRARFNPRDGQLYVVGLKGWQTKGVRDGGFQRVRYTGKPLRMPTALHVRTNGIEITFSDKLARAGAEDPESYAIEQWNYLWTEKYGSDEFSVAEPGKKGRDTVEVRTARLSRDGTRVFLECSVRPVMQMRIRFALKADDGPVEWEIYNTINRVPR